jgi:hypothetical protein
MVINQFHSIGDILFIEPICRKFWIKNNKKPILPVRDHLMWLSNYIESAQFVPMSQFELDYDSIEKDNMDYLPLRFANQIIRGLDKDDHSDYSNAMLDKYILAGLEEKEWRDINIIFNPIKGIELFRKLKLDSGNEYILVNENSQAGKINIVPKSDLRIIYMDETPGFTLIDWYVVILNAKENHHISTSTFFLMQAIANKFHFNSEVFIYPRPNEDGLQGISKLIPSYKCELVS